jgi:hypothetical protein
MDISKYFPSLDELSVAYTVVSSAPVPLLVLCLKDLIMRVTRISRASESKCLSARFTMNQSEKQRGRMAAATCLKEIP